MTKFELLEVEQVNGKIPFFKLSINETCQFDIFYNEYIQNGKFKSRFSACFQIMNYISDGHLIPNTKFRNLENPDPPAIEEYEVKKDEIRIYTIRVEKGFIIIFCAYKSKKQQKDILKFRSIKKEFLNTYH
ncbi:MAG: hypothetical protein EOP42_27070 [Sphingobacteriaceae bacterium]|nr:MAG: hypothetical protein EOP42_27070 [Sphingobacteriaceae bacterium]